MTPPTRKQVTPVRQRLRGITFVQWVLMTDGPEITEVPDGWITDGPEITDVPEGWITEVPDWVPPLTEARSVAVSGRRVWRANVSLEGFFMTT